MNKKRKCIYKHLRSVGKWVISLLLLVGGFHVQAHDVEVIKTIQKAYALEGDELIRLSNKYGKVHINTWEKDRVTIEVKITAYGSDERMANRRLEEVDIEFDRGSEKIEISTEHESELDVKTRKGVHVTYKLNLPAYSPLEIHSKFCDVYIGDRDGNVDINHANGKLVLGRLNGTKNKLKLAFAHTDLAHFAGGNIVLSYGRMAMNSAAVFSLKADGTHIEVGKADEIYLYTNLSNLAIKEVREIKGTFASADFRVEKIHHALDMEVKYAKSFKIVGIDNSFHGVRIRSLYSPIHLLFADQASFSFLAKVQYGKLSYDSESVSMTIFQDEEGKITQYLGKFGNSTKTNGKVEVESEYGHIRVE